MYSLNTMSAHSSSCSSASGIEANFTIQPGCFPYEGQNGGTSSDETRFSPILQASLFENSSAMLVCAQ